MFSSFPRESLRCLRLFVDQNDDQWFFMRAGKDKGAWKLLEQAMASADAGIREAAEEIVHLLGSKGYLEYRELLGMSREAGRVIENDVDVSA